jgi:hypothetical protein
LKTRIETAWRSIEHCFRRASAWLVRHPRRATGLAVLLVLLLAGWEAAYWPIHDYPKALWHTTPRGDDIELGQANAAKAGWGELLGYWHGRMLHGHGYFRPISSWLFVAEYHLFGTEDRRWSSVSLVLHLAAAGALTLAALVLSPASGTQRLVVGVLTGLLFAGPGFADREVQSWVIGWWPAQPEALSLFFGLLLLVVTARQAASETGRSAYVTAPLLFLLAVCCKEMGFVAGLGACLILVRRRRGRPLLGLLALTGLSAFAYRSWALGASALSAHGLSKARVASLPLVSWKQWSAGIEGIWLHLALLGAAGVVAVVLFRRGWGARALGPAVLVFFGGGTLLLGPPWDPAMLRGLATIGEISLGILALIGLARAARCWPIPEVCAIYALAVLMTSGFPPVYAWYRYWWTAFGALLTANALVTAVALGLDSIRVRSQAGRSEILDNPAAVEAEAGIK